METTSIVISLHSRTRPRSLRWKSRLSAEIAHPIFDPLFGFVLAVAMLSPIDTVDTFTKAGIQTRKFIQLPVAAHQAGGTEVMTIQGPQRIRITKSLWVSFISSSPIHSMVAPGKYSHCYAGSRLPLLKTPSRVAFVNRALYMITKQHTYPTRSWALRPVQRSRTLLPSRVFAAILGSYLKAIWVRGMVPYPLS